MNKLLTASISLVIFFSILVPYKAFGQYSHFYDIQTWDENYTAIQYLLSLGRITSYTDGTFRPNVQMGRASFVGMAVMAHGYYADSNYSGDCFEDVNYEWYADKVCYAREQGWLKGLKINDNSKYLKPTTKIKSTEAIKVVEDMFGLDDVNFEANNKGSITRGEAAQLLYQALMSTSYSGSYPYTYSGQYSGTYQQPPEGYVGPGGNSYYTPYSTNNYYVPYTAPYAPVYTPQYYVPPVYNPPYVPPVYTPPAYIPPVYPPPGYIIVPLAAATAVTSTSTMPVSSVIAAAPTTTTSTPPTGDRAAACAAAGITSVPSATPETYGINYCAFDNTGAPTTQALIGQAHLDLVWGAPYDFTMPDSLWAMALAYSSDMFGINPNYLMGLVIKESKADCSYYGGCFQLTGGFPEVQTRYPLYIDPTDREDVMVNSFSTASVVASLYMRFGEAMWDHDYQYRAFYTAVADPEARTKIVTRGYNRGLWDQNVRNMLVANRDQCVAAPDLFSCFPAGSGTSENGIALDHAQAVLRYCHSLMQSTNFYDTRLTWGDIERFITQVPRATFSSTSGVVWPDVLLRAQNAFACLQDQNSKISFRYDFKTLLRSIKTLFPPVSEPLL